jgi:hypothetical protein
MRIEGAWLVCDGGIVRPVVRAEVQASADKWIPIELLVDTGADRTVFSAGVLQALDGIQPAAPKEELAGVGGSAESVTVKTKIRMLRETGIHVSFEAPFAAFTDPAALDMSVLGRDITNLFAVIVDWPQDVVCLLTAKHRYVVVEQ